MTKKTFSKVIATVLVAAMCLTAVFTGAVSAASQTAEVTVVGRGYDVGNTDYLAADVTISSEAAFVAGTFTVSCDGGLVFLDASAAQSNTGDLPEVYMNISNNKVLFAGFREDSESDNDIKSFTELKLVLKFTVASGSIASLSSGSWGVTLNNIDLTNVDEDVFVVNGTNVATTSEDASVHIHSYGEPVTSNGVKTYECSICHALKRDIISNTIESNTFTVGSGANVTFSADGDTILNALVRQDTVKTATDAHGGKVYFTYTYKDDDKYPKTATSTSVGTVTYNDIAYYVFPCGKNGGIGRMNRDIKGNFIHEWDDGTITVSESWTYSIQKYAAAFVNSSDEKIRNYARALWNYGYYTTLKLNNNDVDIASYNDNEGDPIIYAAGDFTDSYALPTSSKVGRVNKDGVLDSSWKLVSARVTTGFRPKMRLVFNPGSYTKLTIQVKDNDVLVYSKEFTISNLGTDGDNRVCEISDIPTKYLIDDIVISVKNNSEVTSTTSFKYGFGRYAKARAGEDDADVFSSMMQYSYHLNRKFASN